MAPATPQSPGATRARTAATRRSTTAKKAAATRSRSSAAATRSRATTAAKSRVGTQTSKTPADVAQQYVERAVLIPVGAALVARDRVVATVNDVIATYSSPTKTQATLRRFERRGNTARNRLERDLKRTRTRVERELRQRRRRLERAVTRLDRRRDRTAKDLGKAQARVENAVQNGITAGTELVNNVQERVLSRV